MTLKNLVGSLVLFSFIGTFAEAGIDVHGHRGARARKPENTLPAFEYAIQVGADYLEMDMAVTKDDHIVISHEPHIVPLVCLAPGGKTITTPPLIHSLTLAEVKKFDCGTLKNPRFADQKPVPGTHIPTLEEVFALVRKSKLSWAKKIQFNIETKSYPDHPEYTVDPAKFARLAVDAFRKSGFLDRIVLQSFDYRTLREARKIETTLRLSALSENPKEDLVATARDLKPDFISPEWTMLNPLNVKELHDLGVKLAPWTVNQPDEWKKLIDLGTDAIITDDPASLIAYLKKNGSRP